MRKHRNNRNKTETEQNVSPEHQTETTKHSPILDRGCCFGRSHVGRQGRKVLPGELIPLAALNDLILFGVPAVSAEA